MGTDCVLGFAPQNPAKPYISNNVQRITWYLDRHGSKVSGLWKTYQLKSSHTQILHLNLDVLTETSTLLRFSPHDGIAPRTPQYVFHDRELVGLTKGEGTDTLRGAPDVYSSASSNSSSFQVVILHIIWYRTSHPPACFPQP
jgi:hypothetical protein